MEKFVTQEFNKMIVDIDNTRSNIVFINNDPTSSLYGTQLLEGIPVAMLDFCNKAADTHEKEGNIDKSKSWLEIGKFILENTALSEVKEKTEPVRVAVPIVDVTQEEKQEVKEEVKEEAPAPKKRGRKPKTEK